MLARSLVCAVLTGLVLAAGGTAAPAADTPTNGRIVFGYLGRLVQVSPDGSGLWPLSAESTTYSLGDWSPDGTRLAIVSEGDIYTVDPRGRTQARLTYLPYRNADPSWSPDGSRILFESNRGGSQDIWMMNADGSSPRQVTVGAASSVDAEWSPDGRQFAFSSFRDGDWELYVADADGTNLRRLTQNPGLDENPSWSPDGRRIAFDSSRDGSLDVFTMAPDGSQVRQLTTSPATDAVPTWSPDSSSIAFTSERSGEPGLYAMAADGSGQLRLSALSDAAFGAAWQPLPRVSTADQPWGRQCTMWGTASADLLVGTPGNDVICGRSGDDRILGGEGGDVVAGEDGNDTIVGGPGTDIVSGGDGDDLVDLRDGERDVFVGGDGRNVALVDRKLDDAVAVARAFDPDPRNLTRGRPVRASSSLADRPPEYAVDGHLRLIWGALEAPAWIEVDLGRYATVGRIQLVTAQSPSGRTLHVVLGKGRSGRWRRLTAFQEETHDGQLLRFTAARAWKGIRRIRVVTQQSPSWVAWREVQAYAPSP